MKTLISSSTRDSATGDAGRRGPRRGERGVIIVMMAIMATMLMGLVGLATCVKTSTNPPSGDGGSSDPTVPGGAVDPGQADPDAAPPPTAGGCLTNADCDGGVCEGLGCGDTPEPPHPLAIAAAEHVDP